MNTKDKKILIIDDSPQDIQIVVENLKHDYAVLVATDGNKGLELAANESRPDVILLDVMMPGMDGYETCRRLKQDPLTRDIDVIFVSGRDTTEEKLAGYDAGGCDYLIKPVQPEELLRKVKLAITDKETREATDNEKSFAMQTAMAAMTSAGEQGVVLEFLRHCHDAKGMKELAEMLVNSVKQYELENTIQLRSSLGVINAGTKQPVPPLEKELLTSLKDSDRIISRGPRAIFNFGPVSMLIKNMPEDSEKSGRLRDHIAILLEGAETRFAAIELNLQLVQLMAASNQAMQELEKEQKMFKESGQRIMDDMLQELEDSFHTWGLTDSQEEVLMNIVQKGIDRSIAHMEKGSQIDSKMTEIIHSLMKGN